MKKIFIFLLLIFSFNSVISAQKLSLEDLSENNENQKTINQPSSENNNKNNQNQGIVFQYSPKKGESTSHVAEVFEEAYINGLLNNETHFINRITTTIKETDEYGTGLLETNYMTTQDSVLPGSSKPLSWGEDNTVTIYRKSNGQLLNSDRDDLPTVRGVPSFPNKPIKIGETWQMKGEEVHDCKELFQMDSLISVPFTADYVYSGIVEENGKTYHKINVKYSFQQNNYRNRLYKKGTFAGIQGQATQEILWDSEKNDIYYYSENFEIEMFDHYNNSFYFTGKSGGYVTDYKSVNNDNQVEQIKNTVEEFNIKDVSVTKGDKGLVISLENIQFEPDSAKLLESEKEKLRKIGEILKSVSNDLLITGHCADRGTESARQELSEQRAASVGNFLVEEGVRDIYHIFTQGKGSKEPVASNKTEEGRAKNRRVEIIIMD